MELDEVLKPDEPAETPTETPEAEAPKPDLGARKAFQEKEAAAQAEGRARREDGTFAPKEEPTKETEAKPEPKPVNEMTDKERALLAAAQDERNKRQALERELAQYRTQPQQPQQTQPEKTFWDDPEGYLKQQEQRYAQHSQLVAQQAQQAVTQTRLEMTEAAARAKYPDFESNIAVFAEVLQATPGLHQHWLNQADPAEFAYRTGKNVQELRQAGSVDTLLQQAEKAARIKLEAEYREKEKALLEQREAIPSSLSNTRGASQKRVTWGGPPSLDSIIEP